MSVTLGGINVNFGANLGPLQSGISSAQRLIGGFGVAAAAAMVGFGVASVNAAGDFQSGLTSLVTGAGEAQSNLKMVGDGILNLSTATGTSTKQLTDGMYLIESAGQHGAAGLNVLKVAAEGAKVGNADLGVTANALTTILTDYHQPASQATADMNALTATVASGKTNLQALGSSMGSILPLASSLGVSFPQVGGAIATMTNAGMSAQRASMNLANALRSLAAPGNTAQTAMKDVGLSAQQVKDALTTQGLTGALQLVEDHIGKKFPAGSVAGVEAFKAIMGGATGYNVALMLTGKNMSTFAGNVSNITGAMHKGTDSVTGWSNVQGNFNQQMAQLGAAVNVVEIKLGTALLPTLTKIATQVTPLVLKFADWVEKSGVIPAAIDGISTALTTLGNDLNTTITFVSSIVNFFQKNQVAADLLAGALVGITVALVAFNAGAIIAAITAIPAVVIGFGAWAVAAGIAAIATLAAAAPFIAIGIVVALVVAGIILAVQHWGEIAHWLQGVWGGIANFFSGLWKGIQGVFAGIGGWFQTQFGNARNAAQNGWSGTVTFFQGVGKNIQNAWNATVQGVVKAFEWLYNHNYYFKNLVDFITNAISGVSTWLQTTWKNITAWISGEWNLLTTYANMYWMMITVIIQTKINQVVTWLQGIWNNVVNWLKGIWTTISNDVSSAWAAISTYFQNAWNVYIAGPLGALGQRISSFFGGIWSNYIAGPLGGVWNSITGWFGNLGNQAASWGRNLIQGFINGIRGMIGSVGQAASDIAGTVTHFLGFHSPAKMGPGKDADKWGPNLVTMFAGGIMAGAPQVARASAMLLAPLAVASGGSIAINTSGPSYPLQGSGGGSSGGGASQGNGDQHIHIMFDGNEMAHYIGKKQQRLIHLRTGVK